MTVIADALLLLSVLVLGRELIRAAEVILRPVARVLPWILEGVIVLALVAWVGGRRGKLPCQLQRASTARFSIETPLFRSLPCACVAHP